jgi:Phage ABA sandwich domain
MNLREIDRLVAEKVMGWRLKSFPGGGGGFSAWLNDDGKIVKYENDCTLHAQPYDFWRPTINITDAWQVVEKLKIAVIPQAGGAPKNMQYLAEIDDRPLGKHYEAFAETAPLAICLVALKAVGVEVNIDELA